MSAQDRRSPLPFALALALVVVGATGLALTAPADGAQAQAQQRAVITGTLEDLELGNLSIRRFRFAAGSRLGWHTHVEGPQLLMMEEGRGRLQESGGPVIEMLPGQAFVTPAGVAHWHGAAPDEAGIQWNIYDGIGVPGSVTWGNAVTDEEYNAPVGR
jgi:quercetin dioxygenase-like cupin family protein